MKWRLLVLKQEILKASKNTVVVQVTEEEEKRPAMPLALNLLERAWAQLQLVRAKESDENEEYAEYEGWVVVEAKDLTLNYQILMGDQMIAEKVAQLWK